MKARDTRAHNTQPARNPCRFLERMERWLGGEYPAFLASYAERPSDGLRVNTLKIASVVLRRISPFVGAGALVRGRFPSPGRKQNRANILSMRPGSTISRTHRRWRWPNCSIRSRASGC